jgi:hypothetical protein
MDIAAISGEDEIEVVSFDLLEAFDSDFFCRFGSDRDAVQHMDIYDSQCEAGQAWSLSTD